MGSIAAMIVVGLAAYFLVAYPSLVSFAGFFAVVPVFLIIGLGFFTIARKGPPTGAACSEDITGILAPVAQFVAHELLQASSGRRRNPK
jgi:hypothetical protein